MIHTSLSRTAHVFAINWSESDNRSLLPGRQPLVKRLLLGVATVAIAVAAGFAAGRSLPSASIAVPVSAPSVAAAAPQLPATIILSEPKLANLQLQIGEAKGGPLVRAVSATGSVGYDQLHLARIKPTARGRIETVNVTGGDRVVDVARSGGADRSCRRPGQWGDRREAARQRSDRKNPCDPHPEQARSSVQGPGRRDGLRVGPGGSSLARERRLGQARGWRR